MEFCPKCKKLMIYVGNKAVCRKCGYEKEVGEEKVVIKSEKNKGEIPVIEGENVKTLPTTKAICPACGNNEAFWWMRQLRAADESEVRFFRCTKCGKTWREYQ
ncbi:MAG: transcription factor S [Archaeoglobales archaeon]|jgi:DNA-directed RNA polymerase subunit M|nr:transcription factor S [Archaeoglobales archaeon]TDA25242.1 MAG: transcription factor S [Archaeoglobi archaeon]TDA25485.1 MAG: transcription factor S [Archaeoglobi archaeon]TDA27569.1 MAG: transcription factor S [Archaeoglobi archaeon]